MSHAAGSTPTVVVGVTGGIAAYKVPNLVRHFTEGGLTVQVVPTQASLHFVGAATWEALSGHPVHTSVFDQVPGVEHVALGQQAELVVVAPATADFLARAAHGRADDLLTTTLLVARCPVVVCPAMHTEMWEHPATQHNVSVLEERGVHVMPPAVGRLTGADTGAGRLPEIADIAAFCERVIAEGPSVARDLRGKHIVVSLGGTQEPLDPVRYLGNRSSGKQGAALASEALARGARVTVLEGHHTAPLPLGVERISTLTAAALQREANGLLDSSDAIIMAAAVADFRPQQVQGTKIKKSADQTHLTLTLERTPDVLHGLGEARGSRRSPVLVGFAAETGGGAEGTLDLARAKLAAKGCDVLVANDVSQGAVFGEDTTEIYVLRRDNSEVSSSGAVSKAKAARIVIDQLVSVLQAG